MRMKVAKPTLVVMSCIVCMVVGFIAGIMFAGKRTMDYGLVREAQQYMTENYLYNLPTTSDLQQGMIEGMLLRVDDPYSFYLPPANHELESVELAGEYGGIGSSVQFDDEGLLRLYPFPGSPAEAAGILPGDILIRVNDLQIVSDMELDTVLAEILGPAGSELEMELQSKAVDIGGYVVVITRAQFMIPSVERYFSESNHRIGILKIHAFTERTYGEVVEAFNYFQIEPQFSVVLDLRGNRGGLFSEAIAVSDFFVDDCTIAVERSSNSENIKHVAGILDIEGHVPMVILIDHDTASAAEIVAAALNECRNIPLLGSTTYGKGSVQSIFILSDGSSMHITTAEWLTGSEASINGKGLIPTIYREMDGKQVSNIMQQAIAILAGEEQSQ